jgi:hypothetical protein
MAVARTENLKRGVRRGGPGAVLLLGACLGAGVPRASAANELVEVRVAPDSQGLVLTLETSGLPPEPVLMRGERVVEGYLPGVSPAAAGCFLELAGAAVGRFQFRKEGDGLTFRLDLDRTPSGLHLERDPVSRRLVLRLAGGGDAAADWTGTAASVRRQSGGGPGGASPGAEVNSSPRLTAGWSAESWWPATGVPGVLAVMLLLQSALASTLAVLALRRRCGVAAHPIVPPPELEELQRRMAQELRRLQELREK